jgi:alpha-tubulin suppressor-like RCC1 family protein
MAGIKLRSVAAGSDHSLLLGWDGRVYSWGENLCGRLGHGDKVDRLTPTPMERHEGVCGLAAFTDQSLAVTQSGDVFSWGQPLLHPEGEQENPWDLEEEEGMEEALWPVLVGGFGGVRVRRVCVGRVEAFAVGEEGELFSWGRGEYGFLGRGNTQDQPSPKRVEALRGVRVRSVSIGPLHALALAEDGLVYS